MYINNFLGIARGEGDIYLQDNKTIQKHFMFASFVTVQDRFCSILLIPLLRCKQQ
jgi:hypothetical protein